MQPPSQIPGQECRDIAEVLAISNELGVYAKLDDLLRHAVDLVRRRLKLERLAVYLLDEKSGLMRGTFGTGLSGETVDERWYAHPVSEEDCRELSLLLPQGKLWSYLEDVELRVAQPRRKLVVGRGWTTITPLLAAGELVGVMYADAALSGSAFDPARQTHAALLGSSLANFVHARRPGKMRQSSGRAGQAPALEQLILEGGDRGGADEDVAGASYQSYRRCRDYLDEHYLPLRNLAELAKACHLTETYLCRLFQRYEGCSPYKRLLRLKMDHAASLLQNPSVSVKCAGLEVGFDDPYHFSKAFKQVLGVPPTNLRAR